MRLQSCYKTSAIFFSLLKLDLFLGLLLVMLGWFFLTPVFYRAAQMPATYHIFGLDIPVQRTLYILNPMASLINVYRDLLYNGYRTDIDFFIRITATAVVALVLGYWFFIRYSDRFGEEV